MSYRRNRPAALVVAAVLGMTLLQPSALGQDAAWEGFIQAGRDALQQENYDEAERQFEDALEAAERFPAGDPRLGKSYNNLAAVYYAQEDYARAEPLMRRALTQLQEAQGTDNTEVAQTMKNLAALYYLQGNRREAESLLKRSLAILERVHGPGHAYVATVLSNLAGLYQADGRYWEAEPLLTRSLQIWEGLLGSDHPDVERSRALLAQVREANLARREQDGQEAPPTQVAAAAETAAGSDEAAAEPSGTKPRELTPIAAAAANPSAEDLAAKAAEEEVARATRALEQLTRQSKTGVPAPSLRPIGEVADIAPDAAAGGPAESGPILIPAVPADAVEDANGAQAILSEAASVDDVSYAVYLSTLWSVEEARRYWKALQDAMPEVLADKRLEIEEVAAADGPDSFFRVFTSPFVSDPQAQEACDRIRSKLRTHDCNVVVRGATEEG